MKYCNTLYMTFSDQILVLNLHHPNPINRKESIAEGDTANKKIWIYPGHENNPSHKQWETLAMPETFTGRLDREVFRSCSE
jgi:hypothetical protein